MSFTIEDLMTAKPEELESLERAYNTPERCMRRERIAYQNTLAKQLDIDTAQGDLPDVMLLEALVASQFD